MKKYLAAGAAVMALTVAPVASAAVVTPDAAPATTTSAAPATATAAKAGADERPRGCVTPKEARRFAVYMKKGKVARVFGTKGKQFTGGGQQFNSRQYFACKGYGYDSDYIIVSYNRKSAYGIDVPVAVNP